MIRWDPEIACDICGLPVKLSQVRKTWDGLQVHPACWSPKHPQLDVRPVRERLVRRPKPMLVKYVQPDYGFGTLCFRSPGGKTFVACVVSDGALLVREGRWGNPIDHLDLCNHLLRVEDDGAMKADPTTEPTMPQWLICTVDGDCFTMTVDSDGAVKLSKEQ